MADSSGASGLVIAVLTAGVTLSVAYASNFIAEQYRRHLDSASWAAALAGELESHSSAFESLKANFRAMLVLVANGEPLPLYSMPVPTDPIFDSAPEKVGSLGPELAAEVAYAYEQLRAFRGALWIVIDNHESMKQEQMSLRLTNLLNMIVRNEQRMSSLINALYAYSGVPFTSAPCMAWWRKVTRTGTVRK